MGMREKLTRVAAEAATEATQRERGRCLWVLDSIMEDLRKQLPKVILNETQRHVIETKIKLAASVVESAKCGIVSGIEPPRKELENGQA